MLNAAALRAKMADRSCSAKDFSESLGLSKSAFYRRLSGKSFFTVPEVLLCEKLLGLTSDERDRIFFADEVA